MARPNLSPHEQAGLAKGTASFTRLKSSPDFLSRTAASDMRVITIYYGDKPRQPVFAIIPVQLVDYPDDAIILAEPPVSEWGDFLGASMPPEAAALYAAKNHLPDLERPQSECVGRMTAVTHGLIGPNKYIWRSSPGYAPVLWVRDDCRPPLRKKLSTTGHVI